MKTKILFSGVMALALVSGCGRNEASGNRERKANDGKKAVNTTIYDTWGPIVEKNERDGADTLRLRLFFKIEKNSVTGIAHCEATVKGEKMETEGTGTVPATITADTVTLEGSAPMTSNHPKLSCKGSLTPTSFTYKLLPDGSAEFVNKGEKKIVKRR